MQKTAIGLALLTAAGLSTAQEMGQVISATPIVQQVTVPQQSCYEETVMPAQRASTGGGAILGAVVGGLIGSALGSGSSGRTAAAMAGAFGGAIVGDQAENRQPAYPQQVQRCQTQNTYENRTMGYSVVYEYAGRQYTTQTATPPGTHIPVQVTPVGGNMPYGSPYPPQPAMGAPVGVVTAPPMAYAAQPVSPAYPAYPRPMVVQPAYAYPVAPVGVSLGINLSSGMRHDLYR
jgi:uncharacterized protein YcfJ